MKLYGVGGGEPKNKNGISHFCLFNKANNHCEGKMSDE
jgi:hypothetical protein